MIGPLNQLDTDVACLGNHDLDFGVEQFQLLAAQCKFPWLCANVLDPALGHDVPLANCRRTLLLESDNGIRVGVIGLVEREWLDTINSLPPNLQFLDTAETAKQLAPQLRAQGADIIVCVSHQREPNDHALASAIPPGTIDLILGGHDHFYGHAIVNGVHILRSGTDFKQLSYLECRRQKETGKWDFNIWRRDIVRSIPEDPIALAEVERLSAGLRPKLDKIIGHTAVPLDARFTTVRLRESNLGNFVADLLRHHYAADCALLAAGTIRGDQVYPVGPLRLRNLLDCFPFEDPCVVVSLPGRALWAALENSVSKYPAQEGRFPHVAGLRLRFDPKRPAGKRLLEVRIDATGAPVELDREYSLATRDYMVRGKDGYTDLMLKEDGGPARSLVSEEAGMLLSTLLRQYFLSLKILGRWGPDAAAAAGKIPSAPSSPVTPSSPSSTKECSDAAMGAHWARIHAAVHEVHPVRAPPPDVATPAGKLAPAENEKREYSEQDLVRARRAARKWWRLARLPGHPGLCEPEKDESGRSTGGLVAWTRSIAPRVEGRVVNVGQEGATENASSSGKS